MNFLFLEITDHEINNLLNRLRFELSGSPSHSNIHITIRGPYIEKITNDDIKKWSRTLGSQQLLIANPKAFRNGETSTVYLGISHPNLRKIWHKPDFPIEAFGFNPHISLYTGENTKYAAEILRFFQREKLELLTASYTLTPYVSKQGELFTSTTFDPNGKFLKLCNSGRVKDTILERAHKLRLKHT